MTDERVELRNGGYYVTGSRISLDSVVYLYRDGASPEAIQDDFPSLTIDQIKGAISFYLAHKQEVDDNIREGEAQIERLVPALEDSRPDLYAKLRQAAQGLKR